MLGVRYLRAKKKFSFVSIITIICVLGILVGDMVMITVLSVMNGFQDDIRDKILGMRAHINISAYSDQPLTDYKYDKEKGKAFNTHREESKKLYDEYEKVLDKINDTAAEVKKRAKLKYKPRNIIDKFANDLDIDMKTDQVADFYRKKAGERFSQADKVIGDKYIKAVETAKKKYNKRAKKIGIGAALIGTAAGLGINQLVKNRNKKINKERRSKNKKS